MDGCIYLSTNPTYTRSSEPFSVIFCFGCLHLHRWKRSREGFVLDKSKRVLIITSNYVYVSCPVSHCKSRILSTSPPGPKPLHYQKSVWLYQFDSSTPEMFLARLAYAELNLEGINMGLTNGDVHPEPPPEMRPTLTDNKGRGLAWFSREHKRAQEPYTRRQERKQLTHERDSWVLQQPGFTGDHPLS